MEIQIDGDWKRLAREMLGSHTLVGYGDYTREVGYALKKLGSPMRSDTPNRRCEPSPTSLSRSTEVDAEVPKAWMPGGVSWPHGKPVTN